MGTTPTANSNQGRKPINTGSTFFERLMYYGIGLLIGLVMVVVMATTRQRIIAQQTAQDEFYRAEAAKAVAAERGAKPEPKVEPKPEPRAEPVAPK